MNTHTHIHVCVCTVAVRIPLQHTDPLSTRAVNLFPPHSRSLQLEAVDGEPCDTGRKERKKSPFATTTWTSIIDWLGELKAAAKKIATLHSSALIHPRQI